MRNIDQEAVSAKYDDKCLEALIQNSEAFMLNTIYKVTGKYVTKSDDSWSVALSALYEAVQCYNYEKGSFLSFTSLVMKRRLIDSYKNEVHTRMESTVDISDIDRRNNEADDSEIHVSKELMEKFSYNPDDAIKLEIEAISAVLNTYGFSFFDLIEVSPKAKKTKTVCAKAIALILKVPDLLNELRIKKMLPIKIIEKNLKMPRKILERHRKYIIAGAEIMSGDYPNLAEYLKYVREEL